MLFGSSLSYLIPRFMTISLYSILSWIYQLLDLGLWFHIIKLASEEFPKKPPPIPEAQNSPMSYCLVSTPDFSWCKSLYCQVKVAPMVV